MVLAPRPSHRSSRHRSLFVQCDHYGCRPEHVGSLATRMHLRLGRYIARWQLPADKQGRFQGRSWMHNVRSGEGLRSCGGSHCPRKEHSLLHSPPWSIDNRLPPKRLHAKWRPEGFNRTYQRVDASHRLPGRPVYRGCLCHGYITMTPIVWVVFCRLGSLPHGYI
jgi:hypothetical protein